MYSREIVTEYDVEIIQSEALLELAKACREYECASSVVTETYSDLNEYATTTEGVIGDFFRSIGELIANFFRKIIDFFKNLFGGGSSSGGSSSGGSSNEKEKPLDEVAKDIEKHSKQFDENIDNIKNEVGKRIELLDNARLAAFKHKSGETVNQYKSRVHDIKIKMNVSRDQAQLKVVNAFIEKELEIVKKEQAERDARRIRDNMAREEMLAKAREAAKKAQEAEAEAERVRKEEIEKLKKESEAKRKSSEHSKNIEERNKKLKEIVDSVKGGHFYLKYDDETTPCKVPVDEIISALDGVFHDADMQRSVILDEISSVKKVIDDFANMDPNTDDRRDAKTSYATNTSYRMNATFDEHGENFISKSIAQTLHDRSSVYFGDVKDSANASELKDNLSKSLYGKSDKGDGKFYVDLSQVKRELDAYNELDDLDKECRKMVTVLQDLDKKLHGVVSDAKDTIDKMSKKYENDKEMSQAINKIKTNLTNATNGTIRTYSAYATVCGMLKRAATNRKNILKQAESSIRMVERYMKSNVKFTDTRTKYTGVKKVSESLLFESTYDILNEYF